MGENMVYDKKVLECFLEKQLQLYPETVADTLEEADEFLDDCCAAVVKGKKAVLRYFEETGTDLEGDDIDALLQESEVFDVGDGRYLIVEG